MSDPNFDGLCGIPSRHLLQGSYFRCKYDMMHVGPHSWERYNHQFVIFGGITFSEVLTRAKSGSPAARAILGMPADCNCWPEISETGELVAYIFSPDCPAHAKSELLVPPTGPSGDPEL